MCKDRQVTLPPEAQERWIPEDWTKSNIGENADVYAGGTPSTRKPEYWIKEIPWMKSGEVNKRIIWSSDSAISKKGLAESSARMIPINSVLIALAGQGKTRGKVAINKIELCTNQSVAAIIPDKNKLDYEFLFHNLDFRYEQIRKMSYGEGGRGGLNLSIIKSIKLILPDLNEQKKITRILSTWDKAIEVTEKLIKNSQAQKKALMQQLLTWEKRLPNYESKWNSLKICQISKRINRTIEGNDYPILMISSTAGFVRQDEKYGRYMAGKSVENYILLKKGEFAYNKGNSKTYQFGCVFDLESYAAALVPHVYVCFKLKPEFNHKFYKYLFESDYLKPQLGRLVNTGVRNNGLLNIKPIEFMNTKVPVPTVVEQEEIANVIDAANKEIALLQKSLDCLINQKKALMQQLLSDKRRVKISDH